jgi:NitT/TauT family transport system permease protein
MEPYFAAKLLEVLTYTSLSLLRMFAGLILSYAFAIPYGILAARSKTAERVLLPLLDVLQSVPILGFFPVAVLFLVNVFQASRIGLELAAIFLIFTSMAWNLAFAVYESISAMPAELDDASKIYRLSALDRLRKVIIPACVPKLVYNGVLSWAGGWFFLIAAEYITLGSASYRLPGLGSFLAQATFSGDFWAFLLGLVALLTVLALVEFFFWLPLRIYAERFTYESVAHEQASGYYLFHISAFAWLRRHLRLRPLQIPHATRHTIFRRPSVWQPLLPSLSRMRVQVRLLRAMVIGAFFVSASLLIGFAPELIEAARLQLSLLAVQLSDPRAIALLQEIPLALLFSLARLAAAYLLSFTWSFPLIAWLALRGSRGLNILTATAEVLASIPATAFFPLLAVVAPYLPGGYWLASVLLTMMGMQWYLVFNLLAGASSIPGELREASSVYRLKGLKTWTKLVLPASLPSLVTGSITAWGGGWNTLIVSEYIVVGNSVISLPGIGSILSVASLQMGNNGLLLVSLAAMVVVVLSLNRLVWKRIYRFVLARYKPEL